MMRMRRQNALLVHQTCLNILVWFKLWIVLLHDRKLCKFVLDVKSRICIIVTGRHVVHYFVILVMYFWRHFTYASKW